MENASKALIIAGAVLISILLISLGIMIYNQAKQVTDNTNLDEVSVTTYNEKFNQYLGEKVKASVVNSLVAAVNQNNQTKTTNGNKILLDLPNADSNATTTTTGLISTNSGETITGVAKSTNVYKVTITEYASSGKISKISIVPINI